MRSYLQKLVMIRVFGDKFMYQHARKAPDEMRELHKQFYAYMKKLKEDRYEIL